jgi:hypothetical protein
MPTSRGLYVTLYILYLIFLGLSLWYLLYYSNVPYWVWFFFLGAIIIAFIGVFVKEYILIRELESNGTFIPTQSFKVWSALYIIFHIIAFILVIIGLGYTINYSSFPWWIWFLFGLALFLTISGHMIIGLSRENKGGRYTGNFFCVIATIIHAIAMTFLFSTTSCPKWIISILTFTYIMAFFTIYLETISMKNESKKPTSKNCKPKKCPPKDCPSNDDDNDCDNISNDDNISDDNIEYVKVISDINSSKNYGDSPSPKNYNLGS